MLHLIWESFDQYGPSNLDGYQVASQQILYVVCTVSCVYLSLWPVIVEKRNGKE